MKTVRLRHTQINKQKPTDGGRDTESHADGWIDRQADRQAHTHTHTHIKRQTDELTQRVYVRTIRIELRTYEGTCRTYALT